MFLVIKALVALTGFAYTLINFIPGVQGGKKKLKKALIIFISTWILLVGVSALEFLLITRVD